MERDHTGHRKTFIHLKKAWYAADVLKDAKFVDEVGFGLYAPDGSTSGEMSMRWYEIGVGRILTPKLEVFDDAFSALAQFNDVIDKLAEVDSDNISPETFCKILRACGFAEVIPRAKHLKG